MDKDHAASEMLANMMRGWPRDASGLPVPPGEADDILARLNEIQQHVQDLEHHAIAMSGFWPLGWESEVEFVPEKSQELRARGSS